MFYYDAINFSIHIVHTKITFYSIYKRKYLFNDCFNLETESFSMFEFLHSLSTKSSRLKLGPNSKDDLLRRKVEGIGIKESISFDLVK